MSKYSRKSKDSGVFLSFHGAAGTVTGSRHLLQVDRCQVLLDAGLFQGLKALRERNWKNLVFKQNG